MSDSVIIAEIQKNKRERIRISIDQYEGRDFLNVRVWFEKEGCLRPGRDGITCRLDLLPEIRKALQSAEEKALEAPRCSLPEGQS